VFLLLCSLGALIVGQALRIQIVEGDKLREIGKNYVRIDTVQGERGNVYADDGKLLATSLPSFEIRMDMTVPSEDIINNELDSLAYYFANYFKDKPKKVYYQSMLDGLSKKNAYLLLKKDAAYTDIDKIKKWPVFKHGRFKGGLIVERIEKREKPFGMLARRTIGIFRENAQHIGLEGGFDNYLKGEAVARSMQRISASTWVPMYENEPDAKNGNDIYTTLNINLQDIVENALLKGVTNSKANHGCAIVMEVKTGKVKAIANLGLDEQDADSVYFERYNYAIGEKSEPGSTFKVAALTALIDDNHVTPNDMVDIEEGKKQFYDKWMNDATWPPHSNISVARVMETSSNVGISKLVEQYYGNNPSAFIDKLEQMHLTHKTGIEIQGEREPLVKRPGDKDWSGISLPWMSIGYELELTPLQMLTFFNAIANNGKMMKPYLVSDIKDLNRVVKYFDSQMLVEQICKPSTAKTVKKILQGVVENEGGTAHTIYMENISIAGKTGTIKIAKDSKGYDEVYQASFAGFFPAENPLYSCIIVINQPSGDDYYGSKVAAPVFKEIVEKFYSCNFDNHVPINGAEKMMASKDWPKTYNGYQQDMKTIYDELKVPYQMKAGFDWGVPKKQGATMVTQELKFVKRLVPNVEGMGLRDAMYVLESRGLRVAFTGQGKVVEQVPAYGVPYQKGDVVSIDLK